MFRLLICQACFASALHHAYLEMVLHKALDPLFGSRFVSSFLGSYDFDSSHALTNLELEKWNQVAVQQSSAWLLKLNQSNFLSVLKLLYSVVGFWKEVMREEEKMRFEDVMEECAWLCVEMCAHLSDKEDEDIILKADLSRDFVYLLCNIHRRPNQTGYFQMLNEMNEQMESVLIPFETASVDIVEYNYDRVNRFAKLMKSLSRILEFRMEDVIYSNKRTSFAEGMLRLASYSRFREHCRRQGSTRDVEIMLSKVYGILFTFASSILNLCKLKRAQRVLKPLFRDMFKPVAAKSMEKTIRRVYVDLSYPLPLSIKWEFEKSEKGMTSAQLFCCLTASQAYRKFARELHQLHNSSISIPEKMDIQRQSLDKYLEMCSQMLPKRFFGFFKGHAFLLAHSMKFDASIVHFSNLPVDTNNDNIREVMGREYLQKIAWWINEVTKAVPVSEREEHLNVMMLFVSEEVSCVIPFEQKEVAELTIDLMIEGGFTTNLIKL